MRKEFNEWVKDYNPNNVTLGPIIMAYLKYVWEHLDDEDGVIAPLQPGVISKYDIFVRTMEELARKSVIVNPDGHTVQTTIMTMPVYSKLLETDERMGVCEDSDASDAAKVRYILHYDERQIASCPDHQDHPKVLKVLAGKWLRKLFDEIYPDVPEQVMVWTCEMFAQKWRAVNTYKQYELHFDKAFWKIYNPEWHEGNFGSCMAKNEWEGNWTFYINSVKAHAAYITKRGSRRMVARCVVFDDVRNEQTGEHYRYAERQYSTDKREDLKMALVELLKAHGYIDINKVVGANYNDCTKIIDSFSGASLSAVTLSVECHLCNGDNISFQDSFGYYSPRNGRAYNKCQIGRKVNLSVCDSWYYNEASECRRPSAYSSWKEDKFHRRYVDTPDAPKPIRYYDHNNVVNHTTTYPLDDLVVTANGEEWFMEDVILHDGVYYPRLDFVQSAVDGAMIPKSKAVQLSNGDYCYKENTVTWEDGRLVHKNEIAYSTIAGIYVLKCDCVEVSGVYIPLPESKVRIEGDELQVMCTNGRWRNVMETTWDNDLHGFYDDKDYVNAYRPFRISDKDKQWEWRQVRTRKDEAWKARNGKWYHRYWVIKNSVDGEPMPKVPRIKFKGLINDAFCTVADWKMYNGKPVRYGLNEQQYKDFLVLNKAIQKNADRL